MQLDWMDYWLKGKESALLSTPPVRIFVMGVNQWRDEREWPLSRAQPTRFYLTAKKAANGIDGSGELSKTPPKNETADQFVFDPRNPVPTRGGSVCCNPAVFPWGPIDQRPVERRPDVLVYTTGALKKDVEVTGPVRVVLYASTSATDTDFTAKLVDVAALRDVAAGACPEGDNGARAEIRESQRFVERFGYSEPYGWSEDKARQYSVPERHNFGPFIRGHGFGLR